MERTPKKRKLNVKQKQKPQENKQKLPGHQGRQVQSRTTKHSEFGFFPVSFPCREGGIWAPASILEKAQSP